MISLLMSLAGCQTFTSEQFGRYHSRQMPGNNPDVQAGRPSNMLLSPPRKSGVYY
ncbi:hypothetical protein NBRC3257_1920 [Gluconobacter thailandicus NBRC 3257]|uniref:Lipoprotein n=1 Tax=Gluconobacter thailandicus NBRC 3257 TaxID=1381097 RepID=A0ABQ0IXI5_GLUTH|nr:hypothetical protein NBRC3257_1920 [Gluconobacter thailandicus NBRC 3257]